MEENKKENRNNEYYSPDLYYVSLVIMRFFPLKGVEVQTIDLHVDTGTLINCLSSNEYTFFFHLIPSPPTKTFLKERVMHRVLVECLVSTYGQELDWSYVVALHMQRCDNQC